MPAERLSDKRKGIAKQAIFARAALVAEQVAGNFRHLEAASDIDIMLAQRTVILQNRREYGSGTATPLGVRLLNNGFDAQARMLQA